MTPNPTAPVNYEEIIRSVYEEVRAVEETGQVAQYIPDLREVNPGQLGVFLHTLDGRQYGQGDYQTRFSIQSIAKVLQLILAYDALGESLWERVGVEPSGTPFNSLVQLEYDQGIPRNPMINAGAIVVCDVLLSCMENPREELLQFICEIACNPAITSNAQMAASEHAVGYRNKALINLMKAFGNIHNDIDEVLDLYYFMCAIEMSCEELSRIFLFLANDGIDPFSQKPLLTLSRSKRINAIMQSCGFYDEAGEFSFRVGLPGKSGVGGGIVAVHPEHFSIAVWSPPLNPKGNSYKGMKFLEHFTTRTGLSVF